MHTELQFLTNYNPARRVAGSAKLRRPEPHSLSGPGGGARKASRPHWVPTVLVYDDDALLIPAGIQSVFPVQKRSAEMVGTVT